MTDETPAEALDRYLEKHAPDLPERNRNPGRGRQRGPGYPTRTIVAILILAGLVIVLLAIVSARAAECDIRGNISRKGDRIYHLPRSAAHAATAIDEAKGERLFCTEGEARAAGWRPAKGSAARGGAERKQTRENPFR